MTAKEELKYTWQGIRAVSFNKSGCRYEGVFCEWDSFEDFYKSNYQRYLRAKRKWKNYKKVTPIDINNKGKYKLRNVIFIRKVKEKGFTKKNTVFTSLSDRMKYHSPSKKIYIKDSLLGTRDVENILKKKGLPVQMQTIRKRINNGENPFEGENRLAKYKYKGKYSSSLEIAEKEKINLKLFTK